MLRTSLTRSARSASTRTFSTTRIAMAAGDLGGTRSGGTKSDDAFSRRERSAEEMWIRQEEREKLKALQAKLKQQKDHLDKLSSEIDNIMKNSGGEHN